MSQAPAAMRFDLSCFLALHGLPFVIPGSSEIGISDWVSQPLPLLRDPWRSEAGRRLGTVSTGGLPSRALAGERISDAEDQDGCLGA